MVLIRGVVHAFDLNMVPEAVSKKLEPMGLYIISSSSMSCAFLSLLQLSPFLLVVKLLTVQLSVQISQNFNEIHRF